MTPSNQDKADRSAEDGSKVDRFGIAEWYGESFVKLSAEERKAFAKFKPHKASRLKANIRKRLASLVKKKAKDGKLGTSDEARLGELMALKLTELRGNKVCPFKRGLENDLCTKDGGVCSLRQYRDTVNGAVPIEGSGVVRALCPSRFHEGGEVYAWVGEVLLSDKQPSLAREVGFLESLPGDSDESADVGRLDMVLVNHNRPEAVPLRWCALEIQAVYFSGTSMEDEFAAIAESRTQGIPFPNATRRPDYRSSGPKRLMPQLQIKVPTLRRWGKKMAVVVDKAFFNALGPMQRASDVSNSDIAWFIVDFVPDKTNRRFKLIRSDVAYTTLEHSVEGLTGGHPVTMGEFEKRILDKLSEQ